MKMVFAMYKFHFMSIFIFLLINLSLEQTPFTYYAHDHFEKVMLKMDKVNADNCLLKSWDELTLPPDSVGQLPVFNNLHKVPWVANRTKLLHLHNMAFNRAYFYSWILQKLNTSETEFPQLPGLHYYYLSASADVSANPGIINGSAVLFDTDCQYANWLDNLLFNNTLPLFGPKAWRLDDWNDEINWLRGKPTNYTIKVTDYGAGPDNNYTDSLYKFNPWIKDKEMQIGFIPDFDRSNEQEHQMDFKITTKYENGTDRKESYSFYGPPQPGEKETFQPVRFTRPYFDCKRSNKWIVTAVGPVVDVMVRYVPDVWKNLRYPRMIGLSMMDIDFLQIDFNPCPKSEGNDPHYFTSVARCKSTTMCEALFGYGFYRGGYQCNCRPGFRLPFYQNGPFQGIDIERATEEEYRSGFDCIPVRWNNMIPTVDEINDINNLDRKKRSLPTGEITDSKNEEINSWLKMSAVKASRARFNSRKMSNLDKKLVGKHAPPKSLQDRFESAAAAEQHTDPLSDQHSSKPTMQPKYKEPESLAHIRAKEKEYLNSKRPEILRKKRSLDYVGRLKGFDSQKLPQMDRIMSLVTNISAENCKQYNTDDLNLPGDVGYNSDKYFEKEGRIALRLAHFLSAYYQNNIQNEKYGNLRPGKTINEYHLYGEVFANIMSNRYILNSGVFYDRQKFKDDNNVRKDMFAPFAYKEKLTNQAYMGTDKGSRDPTYTEKPWFKFLKERWGSNSYGLERYRAKPWIRSDVNGSQIQRYFHYPLFYYVPRYEDGYWSHPYFDCDGEVKQWIITYGAPFFGRVGTTDRVEFMGVVTVSVPLDQLDINQCPSSFYTPNFFKNTATCDYRTTYCTPLPGRHFQLGHYKCECRQGFEYPFSDNMWFFPGDMVEKAYRLAKLSQPNRFDTYVCREGGAGQIAINVLLVAVVALVGGWLTM